MHTSASTSPSGIEVCDDIDNDCDGDTDDADADVDLTTGSTWYTDSDGDGFGDAASPVQACDQPSDAVTDDTDCDDDAYGVNPAADEICDEIDNDCDGDTDDADADVDLTTGSTWYADSDGDGFGDAATSVEACDQPSDAVADDTDCDDGEVTTYPGATDTWYDGVDSDCAEDDDYDADGDGEAPYAEGGTDSDETDAKVYEAAGNCRSSCTPTTPSTLATYDPSGVSDLQFDEDCNAWVTTLISGTDYVYMMDSGGGTTVYTGTSNHNIGSIALDPLGTGFVVSYNNVGYLGLSSGSSIPVIATGGYAVGTNFSSGYLRQSASSMAWDSDGCIWVPNFHTSGSVDCFDTTGAYTTLATMPGYVESVALDSNENLYVSVGTTIHTVDPTGATTPLVTLGEGRVGRAGELREGSQGQTERIDRGAPPGVVRTALCNEAVQPRNLVDAECACDVRGPQVEAWTHEEEARIDLRMGGLDRCAVGPLPDPAMGAQSAEGVGVAVVIRGDHPALDGRERVAEEEAEHAGEAAGADVRVADLRAMGAAGVLEQERCGRPGCGAEQMDGDQGTVVCPFDTEGVEVDIDEDRYETGLGDGEQVGGPGHGRNEDLVAAGQPSRLDQGREHDQQGAGPAVDHDGVAGAHIVRPCAFEGRDLLAHCHPATQQGIHGLGHFRPSECRHGQRQRARGWRGHRVDGQMLVHQSVDGVLARAQRNTLAPSISLNRTLRWSLPTGHRAPWTPRSPLSLVGREFNNGPAPPHATDADLVLDGETLHRGIECKQVGPAQCAEAMMVSVT